MSLSDMSLAVVVQALDTVFTLFGDKTNNATFAELKLLDVLKSLLPRMRSKMAVCCENK